ncbi:hypothetical protein B0T25DRAFT_456667 [Lasiosphaeria hispida]|uniref:Uncharacterized protein n=1 Tax=Lasiosphaeria hispida TaxID=260671 RepID=A0AAJ0HJU3_9PEZI|nr:hypothetical protein B0T25DRAFT_456667 [Lasiosphaeria hispida]
MGFSPICSIPPASPGLVSSPNVRSTFSIIWSCLSVILTCTWAVLHLPVPIDMAKPPSDKWDDMDWRQKSRHWYLPKLYNGSLKLFWFGLSLAGPEILTTFEVMGRIAARHDREQFKTLAKGDGVKWSLAHSHFANMGGFAIKFELQDAPQSSMLNQGMLVHTPPSSETLQEKLTKRSAKHCDKLFRYIPFHPEGKTHWKPHEHNNEMVERVLGSAKLDNLGGHHESSFYQNSKALRGNIWVLDGLQLKYARDVGIIKKLPSISNSQLEEKGNGDSIKTILAVFQLLWFSAELLFRVINGLSVTPLEISTLAFSACSIVTYIACWYKPQSVSKHVYIDADSLPTEEHIMEIAKRGPMAFFFERGVLWIGGDSAYFRENNKGKLKGTLKDLIIIATITSMLFSGIHLLAWNFPFPTVQEQWTWRIVCLVLSLGSIPAGVVKSFQLHLQKRRFTMAKGGYQGLIGGVVHLLEKCVFLMFSVACMGRLFIFAESARSLWFLPSDAFQATPLGNVPHVG